MAATLAAISPSTAIPTPIPNVHARADCYDAQTHGHSYTQTYGYAHT